MSRKSSFNLDRFYQDLQRVESSLTRTDPRRTVNSPLLKEPREPPREEKSKNLAAFKRQLNRKELAKTKINLDMPYEQLKPARPEPREEPKHREEPKPSNYRFSELSGESREVDPYNKVRQRLLCWRKEEHEASRETSNANSKLIHKSEVDDSHYYDFLEKTMETPALEPEPTKPDSESRRVLEQLQAELTRRNEVYEKVQASCGQERERSYFRKGDDLALRLQEHFRQHQVMLEVIQQFKRICGLEVGDLGQLYGLLQEGKQPPESEEELL